MKLTNADSNADMIPVMHCIFFVDAMLLMKVVSMCCFCPLCCFCVLFITYTFPQCVQDTGFAYVSLGVIARGLNAAY